METFWAKISLAGCKWSSLNAPGTQTPYCNTFYCRSPSILCFRTRTAFDAAPRRHAFRRSHPLMIFKRFCDKRFATSASRFHPHLKSPLRGLPSMTSALEGGEGVSRKVDKSTDKLRDHVCDKGGRGQKIRNFHGRH